MANFTVEGHRDLYKQSGKKAFEIFEASKKTLHESQCLHRERIVTRKRLKVEHVEDADIQLSAEEKKVQVENLTKSLKSGNKLEALTGLHRCFGHDQQNSLLFMRYEGLPLLQSCLLSHDSSILHAAAWCTVNLSAAECHPMKGVLHLSPLLIQFLQGTDSVMQELCAWALGNIAGDSQASRETLLQQGVVPHLIHLLSSANDELHEAETKSVLFALTNLARDEKCFSIRYMQDNGLFYIVKRLLRDESLSLELCLDVGWLVCCIYSRKETFEKHRDQYKIILHLSFIRLSGFSKIKNNSQEEQVIVPFLICCGNIIGCSTDMALLASDLPSFLPAMTACIDSGSHKVVEDSLWVLTNFAAEPSCRALLVCHCPLLQRILSLCSHTRPQIASKVLYLLESMTRLSHFINRQLVNEGILSKLSIVISKSPSSTLHASCSLTIVEDLLKDNIEQAVSFLPCLRMSLQTLISSTFDVKLVEKAKDLLKYVNTIDFAHI